MSRFESRLKTEILNLTDNNLKAHTPSLSGAVILRGKLLARFHLGAKAKFYDLASLTKVIFTVTAIENAVKEKRLHLSAPVKRYLPWFPSDKVKVVELLTHSGGLPWWLPFYRKIKFNGHWLSERVRIKRFLKKMRIKNRGQHVYSDIDFIVLGFILEAIYKKDLLSVWQKTKKQLGKNSLHFCVNNKPKFKKGDYAPTERCPWRKKTLQGEVHDDNTWAFGGVSSHAGLFGTIKDVEQYAMCLRRRYRKNPRSARYKRLPGSDWAQGYMMPSKKGSTAGRYFSPRSIGHTGFTGTSIWFDPQKDLIVVVLSNRVHPTRYNLNFRTLRPLIHDAVVKLLRLG
jgi:CubicO group peptidase (beta-lactamase class C family)